MKDAIELRLGDQTYSVRPTFGALVRIEQRIGKSVLALTSDDATVANIKLSEIVAVVYEAVADVDKRIMYDQVGMHVVEGGMVEFIPFVINYVAAGVTAGPKEALPNDGGDKS